MNSKAKLGHEFRGNQRKGESVLYGFGTTTFIVPILFVQQHENQEKQTHLIVRTGCMAVIQLQLILGTIF
jgi:hypothetical protein